MLDWPDGLALRALRAISDSWRHAARDGAAAIAGFVLMTKTNRRVAVTLSILAAGTAFAVPAGAQFAGSRSAFDERARPELVQFNDFFQPFWGERNYRNRGYDPYNPFTQQRPQQSYEPIKPPAPTAKKPDAP